MQVIVNTDKNLDSHDDAVTAAEDTVRDGLHRYAARLTRIEVHLSDESAGRDTGEDKRCLLEARPAGEDPVTTSCTADTVTEAVTGAVGKLAHLLATRSGRAQDRVRRGDTVRHPEHRS